MYAIRNPRKRNHRSSPFTGRLTRSRSQHLLHTNRSGQTRPDPVRKQKKHFSDIAAKQEYSDSEEAVLIKDLCKKGKRNNGELSGRLAKDLRARRVYSPTQSSAVASPNSTETALLSCAVDSDEKIVADLGFGDLGLGSPSSAALSDICVDDVTMSARFEAAENLYLEVSLDAWNFNRGNTESLESSGKLQLQTDGNNGGDCSEVIDDLGEESVLTTPPDAVICADSNVDREVVTVEKDLRDKYTPFAGNAGENSGEDFSGKDDQKSGSVLRSKPVLKPRLPGKLFKAPGSVSYRRLFPFLLDIMGDDSDHCHKDLKGVDGQEGSQPPLSSQSHEASKHELKTNSCSNESNLTPPMQLDVNEVEGGCLSMPSVDDNCARESNVEPTADFHGAKDAGNALHNDDFKQYSIHVNNLDCAKATDIADCTLEQLGVLNEDFTLKTPDAERYDNSVVNVDELQSMSHDACNVKPMDLTISTQENAIEVLYLKADKRSGPHKSKHVPKPNLCGKLFKTPGSVNFRRLLPFLTNLNKDDSGTSKFGDQTHNEKDEGYQLSSGFQLPLPSQSEEVYTNGQMTVNGHVTGSKDGCARGLQFDPSSTVVDFPGAKIVANAALTDGCNQILNMTPTQHYSESPTKDHNMLYINDVSNLACENHSSEEKRFTVAYGDGKLLVNLEKCESVISCPPEGQSLSQLDPNMLDAGEDHISSHAVCKNDAKVLNHLSISSEEPRSPPSEKITSEKQEMVVHGCEKAGSVLKGKVNSTRMPSKRSSNKNSRCASETENGSKSKSALVINHQPIKLLKHTGSINYKRLLPFFLNTTKCNSRASVNAHDSKLRKLLDQTPVRPVSRSNLRVTRDSNDCVPKDHSTGTYGAQQVLRLQACDSNKDRSTQRFQIPESQPSHDSVPRDLQIIPLGPIIDEVITREEAISVLSESLVHSEASRKSSIPVSCKEERPPKAHGCGSLSQLKVREQLKVPAIGSQKGILKRNPRGCRGLCTCLNCVSFRLHAEKAFEFSRNQMLDAEEVAQDLMKELSHLRNMFERYTDGDNNNPVFYGSQVQEACRKAFETEQHAKHRLSEMNDDLKIHCRIPNLQRPRVKFSDHVEEKFFTPGR